MVIDVIEALIVLFGAVATIAAVLLSGVRLSAAEKRKYAVLDRIQKRQAFLFVLLLASTISSVALFFTRQALQRQHSGATVAVERYLAVETVLSILEQEMTRDLIAPSARARQLAAELPTHGTPYIQALKAAAEQRYDDARKLLDKSSEDGSYREFRLRAQVETFAGQFSQALFWYRKALREPEFNFDLLGEYSLALHRAGRYTDARELAEATQALQRSVFGPNDQRLFLGRLALSHILQDLGLYTDALAVLGSACEELISYLGSDPQQEALCRKRRGDLLLELGNYASAESELERALEGLDAQGEDTPIQRAEVHRLRGILFQDLGRHKEAEHEYQLSLILLRSSVSDAHPYICLLLNNLGDLKLDTAQLDEADRLYKEALRLQGKNPNRQHLLTTQHNIARIAEARGDFEEAEKNYLLALRTGNSVYRGKKHKDVGVVLGNIALLYDRMGKPLEAEKFHKEAISVRSETLGEQHPLVANAYNNFGSHLGHRGLWVDAEKYILKSISISRTAFGPLHPDVARSLNSLGALYLRSKKAAKAENILEEALRIRISILGPSHPDTATSLNNLAKCKESLGQADTADELFNKAARIAEHAFTQNGDGSLLPILESYAKFLDTYDPKRAAERRKSTAELLK